MAGEDPEQKGNVVLSRPFQFAEVEESSSTLLGGDALWIHKVPDELKPIRSRWIYAFEFGEHEQTQLPLLAAEYYADKTGKLAMVPGHKRRTADAKDEQSEPIPKPVEAVRLPLIRQGRSLRYAFVATLVRMRKPAVSLMEGGLPHIFDRLDLADRTHFQPPRAAASPDNPPYFVMVVDPLMLAVNLNNTYQQALNEALNNVVVHKENPHNKQVEIESRKYQLARMIRDTLYQPKGKHDPFELYDHLADGGQPLIDYISKHEAKVNRLAERSQKAVLNLTRLIHSPVWTAASRWYVGKSPKDNTTAHWFFEATTQALVRLDESTEGARLLQKLVKEGEGGILGYLYAPEADASEERKERFKQWLPVYRKAATSIVVGLAETAPALIVAARVGAANKQIEVTLQTYLVSANVHFVEQTLDGRLTRMLNAKGRSARLEIDYRKASADLEEWVEHGKPHWPEGTKWAERSELLGRLFIGVEAINFHNVMEEYREGKIEGMEAFGAVLDLAVAAEDPIRAFADRLVSKHPGGEAAAKALQTEAAAAAQGAAHEAAKKEGQHLLQKFVGPAVFKFVGAFSAAIDVYYNYHAGREARGRREVGLEAGRFTVAGGSLLLAIGSILNGLGILSKIALLTAAGSALLVVGLFIVTVGMALVAYFSRSSWQHFALHCTFGKEPASPGHQSWSGGDFSHWSADKEGLDRQIQVLTTMLCAFRVAGHAHDALTVKIDFGAIPPGAKLELAFSITFANGQQRHPRYVIDLQSDEITCEGVDATYRLCSPKREKGRLYDLVFAAAYPDSLRDVPVQKSLCSVVIRYGGATPKSAATGIIPIAKPCDYLIYDRSHGIRYYEFNSLDVKEDEGESEKEADHDSEIGIPL